MVNDDAYTTEMVDDAKASIAPVKSPFGYYGAKLRLVSKIVEQLPPHNAWVEAFCGSAALTLAKKPAPIEVINDLDNEIVNVFQQLRENNEALCQAIALTPYAREELFDARESMGVGEPLERARKFLIATMMTVNATYGSGSAGFSFSQSFSREEKEARVSRWYNLPERLSKVVDRLRSIRIENRDARELVRMFADRPATLIYLDPPYFVRREHKYVIDAVDKDFHRELLTECRLSRCMIIISGYDNELYNSMLVKEGNWLKRSIQTKTRDTSGKDYSRTEVLWTNKFFTKALVNGRVPIRLSSKEKAENKVNPPRKMNGKS